MIRIQNCYCNVTKTETECSIYASHTVSSDVIKNNEYRYIPFHFQEEPADPMGFGVRDCDRGCFRLDLLQKGHVYVRRGDSGRPDETMLQV